MARPKQMKKRAPVLVYLDESVKEGYQRLADDEGASLSFVIRRALPDPKKRRG